MTERCREAFPACLVRLCLNVSAGGYYDWRDRPLSNRSKTNQGLLGRIEAIHAENDDVTGAPRIWEELQYADIPCSKKRVTG
jgi:putative transposase